MNKVAFVAATVEFADLLTDEVAEPIAEALRHACDRIGNILGGTSPTFLAS